MDQKCVKRMKKRRDLDKLIGNGRKHFRKKSGHVLLRTESQSSISSDDVDQLSTVQYRRSRCSSSLTYANFLISICLIIVCCVLLSFVFVMRTELSTLQTQVHGGPENDATKSYQLQEMYNRMQALQILIHQLTLNITQHSAFFKKTSRKLVLLEKEIRHFRKFEVLLGSLSNVPARLDEIKKKSNEQSNMVNGFKNELSRVNQEVRKLSDDFSELARNEKEKETEAEPKLATARPSANISARLSYVTSHTLSLQHNVSELSHRIGVVESQLQTNVKPDSPSKTNEDNATLAIQRDFHGLQAQTTEVKTKLDYLERRFEGYVAKVAKVKQEVNAPSPIEAPSSHEKSSNSSYREVSAAISSLNASMQLLLEHIPNVRMSLGFGVINATFRKGPLGKGVILTRDEYFKLRKFWAKASDSFTLSIQSQQRVDTLEAKFKKLKKQVIASIKNIKVLEAVGLKPTERPVNKYRPEMEINVPIPVYTPTPNPNAYLSLPWVKTARDAEINFARWNRNGDTVLSGEELEPAALHGFMGPNAPSKAQLDHFDVNGDHRLSKKEVLCMFGFISWPCTGKVHELPHTTPAASTQSGQNSHELPSKITSQTPGPAEAKPPTPNATSPPDDSEAKMTTKGNENFKTEDQKSVTKHPKEKEIHTTDKKTSNPPLTPTASNATPSSGKKESTVLEGGDNGEGKEKTSTANHGDAKAKVTSATNSGAPKPSPTHNSPSLKKPTV